MLLVEMSLLKLPRSWRVLPLMLVLLTVGATLPPANAVVRTTRPMVGFTFIPDLARDQGYTPVAALSELVRRLHPDLVRIPIYWDAVAPTSTSFDFSQVDTLLQTIAASNRRHRTHITQVILVVGARNLAWPEVHLPSWVATGDTLDLASITSTTEYVAYLQASFHHFADSAVLYAWQVENEPLDNTNRTLGEVSMAGGVVADEVALLKTIDPIHRAIVTTYNSASVSLDMEAKSSISWLFSLLPGPKPAGHPAPALQLADILGLDIYVVTPSTPLSEATVSERIGWKAQTLAYWAGEAGLTGKEVWVTEMQGAPWEGETGFSEEDLVESAQVYSGTGVGAVLLWGVESWLSAPSWMKAGQDAIAALRA